MNFSEKIIGIISRPEETIKEISDHPYIEEAVLVVGITAILSAISGYLMMSKIIYDVRDIEPTAMEFLNTYMPIFAIVGAFAGVFIMWVIAAGVVHLISTALGGEGRFTQMLVVYGYANVPVMISVIIGMILMTFIEPITITISQAGAYGNSANPFSSEPYFQAISLTGSIFKLWSIGLVFLGVKYVHGLNNGKTLIAVAIPLLFLLFGVITTLFPNAIFG